MNCLLLLCLCVAALAATPQPPPAPVPPCGVIVAQVNSVDNLNTTVFYSSTVKQQAWKEVTSLSVRPPSQYSYITYTLSADFSSIVVLLYTPDPLTSSSNFISAYSLSKRSWSKWK